MTKLTWAESGTRTFESGVSKGVLYPKGNGTTRPPGVAWHGLVSVSEAPNGGTAIAQYIDGVKYRNEADSEEFVATLQAYTYPDEFAEIDGTADLGNGLGLAGQPRQQFDLCYQTQLSNDTVGEQHGYKIHLVYNALAKPTSRDYVTVAGTAAPMTFSWDLTTVPEVIAGRKASSYLVIDSTKTDPYLLAAFEELLYGTGASEPKLPSMQQVVTLFKDWVTLQVTDNGNGTSLISGPDPVVKFMPDGTFTISWHSVVQIDPVTYRITSA